MILRGTYNNFSIKIIFLEEGKKKKRKKRKKKKKKKEKKRKDILIKKEINGIPSVEIIVNFHLLYEIVICVIKNKILLKIN